MAAVQFISVQLMAAGRRNLVGRCASSPRLWTQFASSPLKHKDALRNIAYSAKSSHNPQNAECAAVSSAVAVPPVGGLDYAHEHHEGEARAQWSWAYDRYRDTTRTLQARRGTTARCSRRTVGRVQAEHSS